MSRLLILVVAYRDAAVLGDTLDRVPRDLVSRSEAEILVVDDGPTDRSREIAEALGKRSPDLAIRVLRNAYDPGYGGCQKLGFAYAIESGFDHVALLHADGRYPPEDLPRLLAPLENGEADAVFGSRLFERGRALRQGMPGAKWLANVTLTAFQNHVLGLSLTEYHCGYRAYAASALARIRFDLNTNEFPFDIEIILQLTGAGLRIRELPIPPYDGELHGLEGLRHAGRVVYLTLQSAFHARGLLYQRHLDTASGPHEYYTLKLGYPSSHTYAIEAVSPGSRVLDIGAGPGGVAAVLAERGCWVTAVDREDLAGRVPDGVESVVHDLDAPWRLDLAPYDTLLLLDVVEHLADPEAFLEDLRRHFDESPKRVVFTTPNVAFFVQRLVLALGQFNYGPAGVLDRTHSRLFTFRSFRRLLRESGFRIREVRGIPAPFPKVLGTGRLGRLAIALNEALIRVAPRLFSYQIFVEAETTPDMGFLLGAALDRDGEAGGR